ncbi:hypothetical protein, partial [Cereibacter sediminicola]|uniref:hypothetical protein n=1 Tax=Cereibacter sediminicola TaxID=2584941 RepID=UPI001C931609
MTRVDVDGPEAELLAQLRREWGFESDEKIVVIGNLRAAPQPAGSTIYSLVELRHPDSGAHLFYPGTRNSGSTLAFIGFSSPPGFHLETEGLPWAVGELILAPVREREKRENPYLCNVNPGTLRPLRELPKDWTFTVRGPASVALLEAAAHDAILEKATKSTARKIAALEAEVKVETSRLEAASTALERALSRRKLTPRAVLTYRLFSSAM